MTFSKYHLFVSALADRDLVMGTLVILVWLGFALLLFIRWVRPGWAGLISKLLVGAFYASLVAMAVLVSAHS